MVALWVAGGVGLTFGAFVGLPVKERFTGVKTLQACSGAPVWLSWLASYTWDLIQSLPATLTVVVVFNFATGMRQNFTINKIKKFSVVYVHV